MFDAELITETLSSVILHWFDSVIGCLLAVMWFEIQKRGQDLYVIVKIASSLKAI